MRTTPTIGDLLIWPDLSLSSILSEGLDMSTKQYNKYFDATINNAVDDLIKSTSTSKKPRINRKNGDSKLDAHYSLIQERLSAGKSQGQIIALLKTKFNLVVSKSWLSRYVSKRLR